MKKGFTLAETLITLAIIGVVAALTLPILSISSKQKTFDARHKVCTSDLENAFTTMIVTEGVSDLHETAAFSENKIIENLKKYIKISTDATNIKTCILKNGATVEFIEAGSAKDKDGNAVEDVVIALKIDANGTEEPNTEDKDVFYHALLSTGLLEDIKKP